MGVNRWRIALVVVSLCACASPGRQAAGRTVKPLHHFVYYAQDRENIPGDTAFFSTSAIEGAQIAYGWRRLEPRKDQYDFSMIRDDLTMLTSRGKKLWVQIQDVTFSESYISVPVYLRNDPIYNGGAAKQYRHPPNDEEHATVEGWASRRWDPAVQERFHKLLFALGKEFDGRIEGINMAESSVGFGYTGKLWPKGFTYEIYRDAIITNMEALKRAFPKSVAMQYGNFMPGEWRPVEDKGYMSAVYAAARESGIAMGGPDLMPFRPGQAKGAYPLIRAVAPYVKTGLAVQDGNLEEINPATGKRVTVYELVTFARDYLGLDYIFWGTQQPYYSGEVIPYLQSLRIQP